MKKLLLLALSVFVAQSAFADSCAQRLSSFVPAQQRALCAGLTGQSIASATLTGTTTATGDYVNSTAAKGIVLGEASRAATVTTATTLAAPLYNSISASTGDLVAYVGFGASTSGPVVDYFKTRATSGAATTIVNSGDTLGSIKFWGANGTTYDPAAAIIVKSDTTPGAATDMPGSIDLQTTPDGSVTLTSALKLDSGQKATFGGNVKLSTASAKIIPGATSLLIRDAADANTNLTITDAGTVQSRSTLTANAGDIIAATSGGTLSLQEATAGAACSGSVTANAATPVVTSTTCWTTGSRTFLTKTSTSAVNGSCYISATSNGVSFTITCLATDTGTYNWVIFHEAP